MKTPNFFIVGAPKCGTTSLYEWLRQHPDVFMPNKKEPLWFCEDVREQSKENNSEHHFDIWNQTDYQKLFAPAGNETAVGEASTWYLFSQVAAKNIQQFNPDAKIIIMLRDPVKQIVSSYQHGVRVGEETADSLKEALRLEDTRKDNPPTGRFPCSYLYTKVPQYPKQIKRYQNLFPEENIHVILLDEIKERPRHVYENTLDFLGVESADFTPDFSRENTGALPRFRLLNKALKHPSSPVSKLANLLPRSSAKRIRDGLNKFLLRGKNDDVSQEFKARLKQRFRSVVDETQQIIEKNVVERWDYDNTNLC
jgi:hypothetical protein